jgi:hypothetical protein
MGMDLYGKGGDLWFSTHAWRYALELAHEHGWEPAGTEPPEQYRQAAEDWDGSYFWNSYQSVTDEDAWSIADALERAYAHIPDEQTVGIRAATTYHELPSGEKIGGIGVETGEHLTPYDWYSGEAKQRIRELIGFCRAGGFSIG